MFQDIFSLWEGVFLVWHCAINGNAESKRDNALNMGDNDNYVQRCVKSKR